MGGNKHFSCFWITNGMTLFGNGVFSSEEWMFLTYAGLSLKPRSTVIYNTNGEDANRKDLAMVLGKSLATTARIIKSLNYKNAIKYHEGKYHLNPTIVWKGKAEGDIYKDAVIFFDLANDKSVSRVGKRKIKRVERENEENEVSKNPERYVITDKFGHRLSIYGCLINETPKSHQ